MTAYKQIYKVSTFRTDESVKNLYILLLRARVRAQVNSVRYYTATGRKKPVALEKLKLAPVLDMGKPKMATRQLVPSSGNTERATTAPMLGDGETKTIRPTSLLKNVSNVILFAFFPPFLFLKSHHSLSNLCLKYRKLNSSFSEQYYIGDAKIQDDSKHSSNLI